MQSKECAAIVMTLLLLAHVPSAHSADKPPSGRQIELHWNDLEPFVAGGRIATVLPGGAVLQGRAVTVNENALVMDVSKSSDKKTYPKGRTAIPRDQITTLRLRETKGTIGRIALTLAGIFGTSAAGAVAIGDRDPDGFAAVVLGAMVAGGVGGYYLGRKIDRKTTVIKVLHE